MAKPLPCPFCGKEPDVEPHDWRTEGNAWGRVVCINTKCVAQPSVEDGSKVADERGSAAYKRLAVTRWNRALGRRD